MLITHEKSHRESDDLFTWWRTISTYRANNLEDFKKLALEMKFLPQGKSLENYKKYCKMATRKHKKGVKETIRFKIGLDFMRK